MTKHEFLSVLKKLCGKYDKKYGYFPDIFYEGKAIYYYALDELEAEWFDNK